MSNFPTRKSTAAFLRLEYLPGAIIPPLFGAVLAGVPYTASNILGLVAIGITFHLFVVILNDVVDLPLDRANPARAHYPLVKGTISRSFLGISTIILFVVISPLLPWWGITLSLIFFVFIHRNYRIMPLLTFRMKEIPVLVKNYSQHTQDIKAD